jgi:anion-transporting  ArsA/GET3 family ATPase
MSLLPSIGEADVVVCCGPGGVGKTTVSAALGIALAEQGRRVCVLTVDPARRLAQALGIGAVGGEPVAVGGLAAGSLDALMLDAAGTFDALIRRYATSEDQAQSILSSRLYRSLASTLSGTQEYMAMEKLYELCESGRYDVVVVDTPPTRNALDLLEAPGRLTSFFENRIFRAMLAPARASVRVVTAATRALLGTLGRVAGADLVDDAVAFFQAFAGMEEGFAQRARAVHDRLRAPGTRFLLVTSPREDAIDEARFFAAKLEESAMSAAGMVVNRVHPRFADLDVPAELLEAPGALGVLAANLAAADELAASEAAALEGLVAAVAPAPVARLPLAEGELHDLEGLRSLGTSLTSAPEV